MYKSFTMLPIADRIEIQGLFNKESIKLILNSQEQRQQEKLQGTFKYTNMDKYLENFLYNVIMLLIFWLVLTFEWQRFENWLKNLFLN